MISAQLVVANRSRQSSLLPAESGTTARASSHKKNRHTKAPDQGSPIRPLRASITNYHTRTTAAGTTERPIRTHVCSCG